MKLVFGLGNPGQQYEHTLHNAGFLALDEIADVKATKTGFEIITADGEIYYFDRQEIK